MGWFMATSATAVWHALAVSVPFTAAALRIFDLGQSAGKWGLPHTVSGHAQDVLKVWEFWFKIRSKSDHGWLWANTLIPQLKSLEMCSRRVKSSLPRIGSTYMSAIFHLPVWDRPTLLWTRHGPVMDPLWTLASVQVCQIKAPELQLFFQFCGCSVVLSILLTQHDPRTFCQGLEKPNSFWCWAW